MPAAAGTRGRPRERGRALRRLHGLHGLHGLQHRGVPSERGGHRRRIRHRRLQRGRHRRLHSRLLLQHRLRLGHALRRERGVRRGRRRRLRGRGGRGGRGRRRRVRVVPGGIAGRSRGRASPPRIPVRAGSRHLSARSSPDGRAFQSRGDCREKRVGRVRHTSRRAQSRFRKPRRALHARRARECLSTCGNPARNGVALVSAPQTRVARRPGAALGHTQIAPCVSCKKRASRTGQGL